MTPHDDDNKIREMFAASRRADLREAPDFQEIQQETPARTVRARPFWLAVLPAAATAVMVLLVLAMLTVPQYMRAPAGWKPSGSGGLGSTTTEHQLPPPPSPSSDLAKDKAVSSVQEEAVARISARDAAKLRALGYIGGTVGAAAGHEAEMLALAAPPPPEREQFGEPFSTESYTQIVENDFLLATQNPLSTFSIDVDTASYSIVRRHIMGGMLPPASAVRIEEMVNYFPYHYPPPARDTPFSVNVEIAGCPWDPEHRLVSIGLRGRDVDHDRASRRGANLVFLIDVSGSMDEPNKLPLVKSALTLLTRELDGLDDIAIVVYAGSSGLVLPPTPGNRKSEILAALDRLEAGGGTNGGEGLRLAYDMAREHLNSGGINRVVLATDGDFNLGITDPQELLAFVQEQAHRGISLTALGFGTGNYKDSMLESLADHGDGNYAYIDSLSEARKVLVEQVGGTMETIAKDVKIQIEFNPALVGAYRLIGYENRVLRKEDFNDDRKDAGEIGSGHTVTALYEVVPPGKSVSIGGVDPLKYQKTPSLTPESAGGELLTLKLRYKDPAGGDSRLISSAIVDEGRRLEESSEDFRFAAAVAAFGLALRESPHRGNATLEMARELGLQGLGPNMDSYRVEFMKLVDRAASLRRQANR